MLIWLCMTQNVWLGLASPSSQRVELQVYIMGEWNCISSTNRIFVGETTIWTKSSKLLVIWRPEVVSMKCPFVTLATFITQVVGYQKSKILYGPFLEKLHKKHKNSIPFCPHLSPTLEGYRGGDQKNHWKNAKKPLSITIYLDRTHFGYQMVPKKGGKIHHPLGLKIEKPVGRCLQ